MVDAVREGGCLCGAVRYKVVGEPLWVAHCHCRSCRKASGAPMQTWIGLRRHQFSYTRGASAVYESSPGVRRAVCAACGTPLTYEAERIVDEVHVTIGALDDPATVPPTLHVWWEERLSWLHADDGLPKYARRARGTAPVV